MAIDNIQDGSLGSVVRGILNQVINWINGRPKVYKAIISQSGTSAPTVVAVLENTAGTTTFNYDNVGLFTVHNSNFAENKVLYSLTTGQGSASGIMTAETGQDITTNEWEGRISTLDLSGNAVNGILYNATLTIEFYP